LTEEILPIDTNHDENLVVATSAVSSARPSPAVPKASPAVNQHQLEPTTMRMEAPAISTTAEEVSPTRPDGSEHAKTSIENDINDAVGLSIQDIEGSSTGEREFGTTS
jgi:hypothetical protein